MRSSPAPDREVHHMARRGRQFGKGTLAVMLLAAVEVPQQVGLPCEISIAALAETTARRPLTCTLLGLSQQTRLRARAGVP